MAGARSIWLVTKDGVPKGFSWGLYKTQAEEADPDLKSLNAALKVDEATGDGWDATVTAWRRIPQVAYPHIIEDAGASPVLSGTELTIAGCLLDINDTGATVAGRDDDAPLVTIQTVSTVVDYVEGLGTDLVINEKTSDKRVLVLAATQADAHPCPAGYDSVLYKQTSDSSQVRVESV